MPMRAVLPTKALPEMPLNLWGDLATSGHVSLSMIVRDEEQKLGAASRA